MLAPVYWENISRSPDDSLTTPLTPSPMSATVKNGNSLFLINYATQILCFVVVTPLVWLRIFVRWRLKRALGIDDGMEPLLSINWAWLTVISSGMCCRMGMEKLIAHTRMRSTNFDQVLFMGYCANALLCELYHDNIQPVFRMNPNFRRRRICGRL